MLNRPNPVLAALFQAGVLSRESPVGGNGTEYADNNCGIEGAWVDDLDGKTGYLTHRSPYTPESPATGDGTPVAALISIGLCSVAALVWLKRAKRCK